MNNRYFVLGVFIAIFSNLAFAEGKETITFPAKDGIEITADEYIKYEGKSTPLIVLFHQAGWSRGEYLEIAPKLNDLGFNCIAVDLRAGELINGVENETAINAKEANKKTRYIDALEDMIAALHFVRTKYSPDKVIAWGSSYSAALVLHIAGEYPKLIDGALSFAPGEYFANQGKTNSWIEESAANIEVPVFITSARNENNNWSNIFEAIKSRHKISFIPSSKGNHGSRALWDQFEDSADYWEAVNSFLASNFH